MKKFNPWQWLVFSFIILIISGAILLKAPWIEHQNGLSWTDAFFTSTSAVCVTGLTSVSTTGFNIWGQLTILLLLQTGAIGIMTLTTSFFLFIKRNVGTKYKLSFAQTSHTFDLYEARIILKRIIILTWMIEFIGFILLSIGFLIQGLDPGGAMFHALFHSASAFANAGFSTFENSLTGTHLLVKITVMILIALGGLGYFVLYEISTKKKLFKKYSLHTKIVLLTSIILWAGGFIFFLMSEGRDIPVIDALFLSVTARTAGFNTIEMSSLSYASVFLLFILMFIGASPGSTGGGIKTTNAFVMIYSIWSLLKGRTTVTVFNRTIPLRFIMKAFATATLFFIIISIASVLLLEWNDFSLVPVLFEVISALGTVGLSLGITSELNEAGKWIIILLMFIGRVGPASLALAVMMRQKEAKIKYPEEEIF